MKQCKYPVALSLAAFFGLFPLTSGLAAPLPTIDAGSTLQNTAPPKEALPTQKMPDHLLDKSKAPSTEQPEAQAQAGPSFQVQKIELKGLLPAMRPIVEPLATAQQGKQATFQSMQQFAQQITQVLQEAGYPVAFAYVPPQAVHDGIVTLQIVPGVYGEIVIEGSSKISPERLRSLFFAQKHGEVIETASLERALRLANELAGVEVKGSLRPGKDGGSADLVLTVKDGKSFFGSLYSDNWGSRYSGRERFGFDGQLVNSLGQGEAFSFGGMLTSSSQIHDYHIGYRQLIAPSGWTVTVNRSQMHYTLGDSYQELGASGKAVTDSITFAYPLVRQRDQELNLSLGYEQKRLEDIVGVASSDSRKKSRAMTLGLYGSSRDEWQGGGVTQYSLNHVQGHLGIEDAVTQQSDALYNHSSGSYRKEMLQLERTQWLNEGLTAKISFTGQLAGKNLDSSEKLYLGGATGVRAYPQGESGGDEGYLVRSELYWRVPGWSQTRSEVSLVGFYDYGSVTVNKNPWSGAGENKMTLSGAGLGLEWNKVGEFRMRLDYAWKVGSHKAQNDTDKSGRLWLQMIKGL